MLRAAVLCALSLLCKPFPSQLMPSISIRNVTLVRGENRDKAEHTTGRLGGREDCL